MKRTVHCPRCGARLPADAPEESLCPQCLLKLGLGGSSAAGDDDLPPTRNGAADPQLEHPESIGPYRVLEVLGEGGMGIVYLAEQTRPVRRRVALKVIKLGMDTKQVIARFEVERQALAVMNHPNVAKVFDAGATEQGRPYFVMEYVPGIPITEYCDLRCLPVRERLDLFILVCEAIQHAHQKGIIHRDIKPSNVLVASDEGKPSLKVIDFGVAKATSQRLTEMTLFTQQGLMIGTPEYMSPEQARTTALDVDTRTDIYSLGVLLYELLVGSLPFDPKTLRQAAAVEMLRIIREEDPPRPTVKFSSLGDTAPEVAKRRHTDVRSLARQLRGELEWITMRALEKDPARRYASASGLAADVRRHLDDEPVTASPPSQWYRLRKFMRKNKGAVAATAVIVAVFFGAAAVSTTMYFRAESARQRAEAEALRNRLDSAALQAVLLDDGDGYRERSRQALEVHRKMLDPDDPEYAIYLVNRLVVMQFAYWDDEPSDGSSLEALVSGLEREAVDAVRRTLPSRDPRLIEALDVLAGEHWKEGDPESREWAYREALALRRDKLPPDDPGLIVNLEELSDLVGRRSMALRSRGAAAEADLLETEALELGREALLLRGPSSTPDDESSTRALEKIADLLDRRGSRLLMAGEPAAAEPLLRESLDLWKETRPAGSRKIAALHNRLGRCLTVLERFSEAESVLLRSYRSFEGELEGKSASMQVVVNDLVDLYEKWKRPEEAARFRSLLTRPTVVRVRELGPLQFRAGKASRWEGRHDGFSALLAGRSLWVFSITTADPQCENGRRQCSGTWSWTDDRDASDGIGAFQSGTGRRSLLAEPIPYTENEAAYNLAHVGEDCVEDCGSAYALRPRSLAADPARGRALVFFEAGFDPQPPWSFVRAGTSLALWTDPTRRPARISGGRDASELFSAEEPSWGSGALVVDDDLYTYACECREGICPCLVARVPLAEALDRRAWRFFAGAGRWSTDWKTAVPVVDGASQLTVHWNEHLGKYLAVHSVPGERTVALRTADRPEGLWSEPQLYIVGVPPPPDLTGRPNESALGHPEFTQEGGRVEYITYHRPTGHFWEGETRLVEVVFK